MSSFSSRWITLSLSATTAFIIMAWKYRRTISSLFSTSTTVRTNSTLSSTILNTLKPIPIPACTNLIYSHGGFMGASVECIRNPYWLSLLQLYTPKTYLRLYQAQLTQSLNSTTIMRLLENNPVVAAYGVYHYHQYHHDIPLPVIEWDVYFHPINSTFALEEKHSIMKHTVVSHGTLLQTFMERILGYSAHTSVLHESGGMTIPKWLEIFMECLDTVTKHEQSSSSTIEKKINLPLPLSRLYNSSTGPLLSVFLDIKSSSITSELLMLFIQQLNSIGIHVWGIGSFLHTQIYPYQFQKQIINTSVAIEDIIKAENKQATGKEAANIHTLLSTPSSKITKNTLDSTTVVDAPLPFHIFTFASGIIQGCKDGTLPSSAHILFNAGSLFMYDNNTNQWILNNKLITVLRYYQQHYNLSLGAYTQESHLNSYIATLMINHFNEEKQLYSYGLSYSNLPTYCSTPDISSEASNDSIGLPIPFYLRKLMEPNVD